MYVCRFAYLKDGVSKLSSSDDDAITYVVLVSWMTSCLPIMCNIWRVASKVNTQSGSPGGSTGAKLCHV